MASRNACSIGAAILFLSLGVLPAHAQQLSPNGLPTNPDAAPRYNSGNSLDQLMAWERQDMGVPASRELHAGPMHGPTPNQIPGGQVITTKGLLPLMQQPGMQVYVLDALGGQQTLPNAIPAVWTSQPGSFSDATQQQMGQFLRQVTRGNNAAPLVFYCGGPQCWMSYNAALRAIQLGYRNVLWYRGGLEAWQRAGQSLAQAHQQMPQQGMQPAYPPGPQGAPQGYAQGSAPPGYPQQAQAPQGYGQPNTLPAPRPPGSFPMPR